jgi:hypothetical protein
MAIPQPCFAGPMAFFLDYLGFSSPSHAIEHPSKKRSCL